MYNTAEGVLVINYREGGYKTGGGASYEGLSLQKGGGGKSFSHAKGGRGTTSFGVVFMRYLEGLAILMGGGGEGTKSLTLS